jgi:hypothetical protein
MAAHATRDFLSIELKGALDVIKRQLQSRFCSRALHKPHVGIHSKMRRDDDAMVSPQRKRSLGQSARVHHLASKMSFGLSPFQRHRLGTTCTLRFQEAYCNEMLGRKSNGNAQAAYNFRDTSQAEQNEEELGEEESHAKLQELDLEKVEVSASPRLLKDEESHMRDSPQTKRHLHIRSKSLMRLGFFSLMCVF